MSFTGIDLCQFPTGTPPQGKQSNFVDPPTLTAATWGITISMTSLALLFTFIRICVNFRKLGPSDYFVVTAIVLQITYGVLVLELAPWARHAWDVPVCWVTDRYMQLLFSEAMVYAATTFFSKASILLLYLQLFSVQKRARVGIWAGLISTGVLYWAALPIEIPFMIPSKGQTWQALALSGSVVRISVWGLVQGPLSIILDIYIFVIPFPILARLNLSVKRRLELLFVFATAFLAVAASIVGLVYRYEVVYSSDESWSNASIFLCCLFENNIAIVVSCMPAFAAFTKSQLAGSSFFKSLRTILASSKFRSSEKSEPSPPNSWNKGIVTFGQGNDRPKGQDDLSQQSHTGRSHTMQSTDDLGHLLDPRTDSQLTTAITSKPMTVEPARGTSDSKSGINKTTEVSQHCHLKDCPASLQHQHDYELEEFDPLECYPSVDESHHNT